MGVLGHCACVRCKYSGSTHGHSKGLVEPGGRCHNCGEGTYVEWVPVSQLEGAVEERDRLRGFVDDFLAWQSTADLNQLAGRARALTHTRGQSGDVEQGEPTYEQLADDADSVAIQRDDLRERLDRIRAAAESDPDLPDALRGFLLRETTPGWLHVTAEMVGRLRSTGSHHAAPVPSSEGR